MYSIWDTIGTYAAIVVFLALLLAVFLIRMPENKDDKKRKSTYKTI